MDGRRHSVDIPISKTLVALRRVRSLRDPSTTSTSKFSALVDNVNWETNSGSGISLRFLDSCLEGGGSGKIHRLRTKNVGYLDGQRQEFLDDFNLSYDLGKSKFNSYEVSGPLTIDGGRYCSHRIDNKSIIPSINPLEDIDSCNELSIGQLPEERTEHIASERKFQSHNQVKKSFGIVGNGTSPSLSLRDALSSRSTSLFANEEVDDVYNDDPGCGISCCWSGTPRFRESSDVENNPLLCKNVDEISSYDTRCLKYNCNEIVPHSETPRSLSQKFRPKSFGELVGQNVVARSLLGAIIKGRITSLYLFHGPRGTGKTSASRIFAAALNCLSLEENRPCGICRECVMFFSGRSRDVKEVDPVRINRRERVRSLIKKAAIPPVSSRFKIFIFDECHLLHGETWATVLHSLDNLSQHVIFVMIAPDLDKLPRSALSRSQRYHFPKIKDSDISGRLVKICHEEGLDFDQVALDFIAAKSSGSMRDAEMMLDQLSLLGKRITMSLAYELIGIVSDDELLDLLDLAMSSDTSKTVIRARELMRSRIDPMQLTSQLANLIMDVLAGNCQEGCSEVRRRFSSRHTSEVDLQKLSHALKILSETEKQLRMSKNQTTWLTVALLQLSSMECSSEVNDSKLWLDNVHERGESWKHVVSCSCEERTPQTLRIPEDYRRTLESIWKKATELCQSSSFKNFLLEQGKLSSLVVSQGRAVAELEFCHPNCISKAEKSQKLIANLLRSTLDCNVEIKINLVPCASSKSRHAKVKKPSFKLFSCCRRVRKSQPSTECGSDSDYSEYTSERPMISERCTRPFSDDSSLKIPHECCHRMDVVRTLGNGEGNVQSTRTPPPHGPGHGSLEHRPIAELVAAAPNESRYNNEGCVLPFQEPENQPNCFARTFRRHKKSRSSDASQLVCRTESQQKNMLALSIVRKASSETSVTTSDTNNNSNTYTNSSGDENGLRENSETLCWRTPTFHLKKAWRSRHQQENSQLVRWVLPCASTSK
ncbi:protein STICHEL-like 2 [Humulus lupulus]|uniref:protein STICHEL-like 2 n=1 Tax=Humulus lupulus TaxID=3486 RepID=UPI002B413092|nr:protein STICHEL-like 2 [Humulus lupulus]XP_062116073.1 protein STICHEL-like 2 [Humulus lupulus]XP_062116074.1 protein STICHEL-like 2 [Humulus lupulus]